MGMGKLLNLLVIKNKKTSIPPLFAHFYSGMIQNVFVFFAFLINDIFHSSQNIKNIKLLIKVSQYSSLYISSG